MCTASCQKSHGDALGRDAQAENGACHKWWGNPIINKRMSQKALESNNGGGGKERIQVCSLMNPTKGKSGLKGASLKTQSTY